MPPKGTRGIADMVVLVVPIFAIIRKKSKLILGTVKALTTLLVTYVS